MHCGTSKACNTDLATCHRPKDTHTPGLQTSLFAVSPAANIDSDSTMAITGGDRVPNHLSNLALVEASGLPWDLTRHEPLQLEELVCGCPPTCSRRRLDTFAGSITVSECLFVVC